MALWRKDKMMVYRMRDLTGILLILTTALSLAAFAAGPAWPVPEASSVLLAQKKGDVDGGKDADATQKTEEKAQATPPTDDRPIPEILTDLEEAPFPVRKMRELILEAANSGDVEKLRPYIGYGDDITMLSLGGFNYDPIDFLKSLSGDPEGHEILAIMTEILEAPFVRLDEGTEQEVYVWPYYFSYPIDLLTPEQRVNLFRIITFGDYEEMASFGNYIFYRLGITPQGRWQFFVAGD